MTNSTKEKLVCLIELLDFHLEQGGTETEIMKSVINEYALIFELPKPKKCFLRRLINYFFDKEE